MVGVIPPARRCGRDAGFRFDQPLDNPRPTVRSDRAAIDRYCVVSNGSSGACGLGTHLIEGCGQLRSSEATRPSGFAPLLALPVAGWPSNPRSAQIKTSSIRGCWLARPYPLPARQGRALGKMESKERHQDMQRPSRRRPRRT